MKKILFSISLLVLISCQPTKTVEPAATPGNINIYAPYMWDPNSFPKNLKISNSFSADEVAKIQAMSTEWESSLDNKNFFTNTNRTAEISSANLNLDDLGGDGVLGIYKINHWGDLGPTALAVTQLFGRRYNIGATNEYVKIIHADILINYERYNFRLDSVVATDFDLQTVILHEMGHFLGLNHNFSTTDSVMYPSIDNNDEKREPHDLDIDDLASKYSLADSSSSAIRANKPAFKPAPNDPGQMIKILIELRENGDCVHTENGVVIHRHSVKK